MKHQIQENINMNQNPTILLANQPIQPNLSSNAIENNQNISQPISSQSLYAPVSNINRYPKQQIPFYFNASYKYFTNQ